MNPDHKQVFDFVEKQLLMAKNIRPSLDKDASSDSFWKLTGKIEAYINVKKHIEEQYLTRHQKPRECRLDKPSVKKNNPLQPVMNEDFELEDLFGDF